MATTFRTILPKENFSFQINHQDQLLALGSCFAVHLGHQLLNRKFSLLLNPFGIIYNPMSLASSLQRIIRGNPYSSDEIFEYNDLWHSFDHHGHFSSECPTSTLSKINNQLQKAHERIYSTNRLLITLGTSNAFKHIEQDRIVANCHKVPSSHFKRFRLNQNDIINSLKSAFQHLKEINSDLEILITVSPVRHQRDGFIENQRSKASLLLVAEQLERELKFVSYFPAYELLLDDLRDYRFYEQDMLHPNSLAIEYIWNYFASCFFKDSTINLLEKVDKLNKAVKHRPLRPSSDKHQTFLQQQLSNIKQLEKDYSFLSFSKEKTLLEKQLIS